MHGLDLRSTYLFLYCLCWCHQTADWALLSFIEILLQHVQFPWTLCPISRRTKLSNMEAPNACLSIVTRPLEPCQCNTPKACPSWCGSPNWCRACLNAPMRHPGKSCIRQHSIAPCTSSISKSGADECIWCLGGVIAHIWWHFTLQSIWVLQVYYPL